MLKTVADARSQAFTLPEFKHWRGFAMSLDGYAIGKELGFDVMAWGREQVAAWTESGAWPLDVLHLRLMLFYAHRVDYWTGYDYTEQDDLVDSLLYALSEKTGLPYAGRPTP